MIDLNTEKIVSTMKIISSNAEVSAKKIMIALVLRLIMIIFI